MEVCGLAVVDCGHAEAACGLGVRSGVVDEQALVDGGVDPLRGGDVDVGVGFGVAVARGVDEGVEEVAQSQLLQVVLEPCGGVGVEGDRQGAAGCPEQGGDLGVEVRCEVGPGGDDGVCGGR